MWVGAETENFKIIRRFRRDLVVETVLPKRNKDVGLKEELRRKRIRGEETVH